jgi:predicted transcriptional regulator
MRHGTIEYPTVVGVRLSREQADQLRQLARRDDRPVSAIIRRLVTETLNEQQSKEVTGVR